MNGFDWLMFGLSMGSTSIGIYYVVLYRAAQRQINGQTLVIRELRRKQRANRTDQTL